MVGVAVPLTWLDTQTANLIPIFGGIAAAIAYLIFIIWKSKNDPFPLPPAPHQQTVSGAGAAGIAGNASHSPVTMGSGHTVIQSYAGHQCPP